MSFGYSHQSGIGLVFDLEDINEYNTIFDIIKKVDEYNDIDDSDDIYEYFDDTVFYLNSLTCYYHTDLPRYSNYHSSITGSSREVTDIIIIEPNVHYNTPFITPEVKSEQELVEYFRKELGDLIDADLDISPYLRYYDCYFAG